MSGTKNPDIEKFASLLDENHRARTCISPFARTFDIDVAQAYAIQRAGLERRCGRGERPAGFKLGFTSEAMRRQMNVHSANIGFLTDAMMAEGSLDIARLTQPRAEPEIALRIGRDLHGPVDRADVEGAIIACAPAIEIVDSAFRDYRFTAEDNIADNSSAAAFALGPWQDWPRNLDRLAVRFVIDGHIAEEGDTAAAMGHPVAALVEAVRLADAWGYTLIAGSIILTGGLTAAPYIRAGHNLAASIDGLGEAILAVR